MLNPKHTNLIPWINSRNLQITVFISSAKRMRWISLVFHRKAWIFLAKLRNYVIWKQEELLAPEKNCSHPVIQIPHFSPCHHFQLQGVLICKQWVKAGLLCASNFPIPRMRQQHFVCRMRWDKGFLFAVSDDAVSCQDCIAPEKDEWIWNTSWTGGGMPWEKPVAVLLSPAQIPHRLTSACIRVSETRCRPMTARDMAQRETWSWIIGMCLIGPRARVFDGIRIRYVRHRKP